jgi:HAE1 family hydrophobic/amphiphilic exporter-1
MVKKVEEWLKTREEIQNYFVAVGGLGGGDTNTAILFVTLKPPSERPKNEKGKPFTQGELMRIYREKLKEFPFYRYSLFDLSLNFFGGAGTRGYPVELSLRGPDMAVLKNLSETVLRELKFRGVIADGETDLFPPVPEIHVIPDREKGEQYGVTGDMIARTIQIALGGIPFAKYSAGGRRYDVWISLPDSYRNDPDKIGELLVRNQRGELIPLKKVVKVVKTPSPLSIQRANRERAVGIFANPAPEKSQEEVLRTALTLGKNLLPPGYTLRVTGSAETFQETFRELAFAFFLGIVIAYMILVVQFNSYLHPFTILTAMPFGITGALLGLYFQKQSLNLMSFIGILLLMGIVKKNSVLLVDFTNQARRKGMEVKEAILYASPLRLRPILMTSLAIMAGALPSVLHLGPGYEIRTPIGIVILWGTFLSTLITLYVVPAFYLLLSPLESHRHEKAIKEAEKFLKEEKYPAESPF